MAHPLRHLFAVPYATRASVQITILLYSVPCCRHLSVKTNTTAITSVSLMFLLSVANIFTVNQNLTFAECWLGFFCNLDVRLTLIRLQNASYLEEKMYSLNKYVKILINDILKLQRHRCFGINAM